MAKRFGNQSLPLPLRQNVRAIWSEVLSKGQDLSGLKCQHILETKDDAGVIPCDGCGVIKTRANFNSAEH